jgi:hypothetical protein
VKSASRLRFLIKYKVPTTLTACSINYRGEITGLGQTGTGEIHTYLATPTRAVAASESTSQGVISRRILSDNARKLLQQQLRYGRTGARFVGPQSLLFTASVR